MGRRLIYRNWVALLGTEPDQPLTGDEVTGDAGESLLPDDSVGGRPNSIGPALTCQESERVRQVREAVTEAVGMLSDEQQEVIRRFYFMGQTLREIAETFDRPLHRMATIQRQAVRELRRRLAPLARQLGLSEADGKAGCPVCSSPFRAEIDRLIRTRDRTKTWSPVMEAIRKQYQVRITHPQVLIGHEKYH